jgi:serine protease
MSRLRLFPLIAVLFACGEQPTVPSGAPRPGSQNAALQRSFAQDPRAFWRGRSDAEVWAAIERRPEVNVGLRTPGHDRGVLRGRVVVPRSDQRGGLEAIRRIDGITILAVDTILPIVLLRVATPEALGRLRRLPHVDYVEPRMNFSLRVADYFQSSCGGGDHDGEMFSVSPGDVYGSKYFGMRIPPAWELSSGSGITLGLVDTGVDPVHPQLNQNFATGMSTGRFIHRMTRYGSDAIDHCGHGTHMAGIMAAPRDGSEVVGVAWGSSLVVVRVGDDPWLEYVDEHETRLGIRDAASMSRITLMGFGATNSTASIQDEISYWYYNFDKMFIAPGGNSPECPWGTCLGVLFPAREPTVVAVSGTSDTCDACIYGEEIDFVTYTGNPTTGAVYLNGEEWHPSIGNSEKSSGASAVFAGIAALVWSAYPNATRDEVLERLRQCSSHYPSRSFSYGWGEPNVWGAVAPGLNCGQNSHYSAQIMGPSIVQTNYSCTWTATTNLTDPHFAWYANGAFIGEGPSVSYAAPGNGNYAMTLEVQVSNFQGHSGSGSRNIEVDSSYPGCSLQ